MPADVKLDGNKVVIEGQRTVIEAQVECRKSSVGQVSHGRLTVHDRNGRSAISLSGNVGLISCRSIQMKLPFDGTARRRVNNLDSVLQWMIQRIAELERQAGVSSPPLPGAKG